MKIKIPDPKDIKDERHFQIRDVGSDGCGSFMQFCISCDTTNQNIFNIACEEWTKQMLKRESLYIPGFFRSRPYWRPTLRVVERKRAIRKLNEVNERTGRDYVNEWNTKRGGLKFAIVHSFIKITMTDGSVQSSDGYRFGKII